MCKALPKEKRKAMTFEDFCGRVMTILRAAPEGITWTDIQKQVPQLPNKPPLLLR